MEDKRITPYPLRMPSELRDELEKIANTNGRSLNSEITLRLQESLKFDNRNKTADVPITDGLSGISYQQWADLQLKIQQLEKIVNDLLPNKKGS